MIGCLAAVVLLVAFEAPAVPGRAALIAVLLPVCAVACYLFAVPLAGSPPPPTTVIATATAGATVILACGHVLGASGFPWVLPLAAMLAAAHAAALWPVQLIWPLGAALAFAGSWLPVQIMQALGTPSMLPGRPGLWIALTDTGMTVLCAASLYAQVWMCEVAERLDRARRTERTVAVTVERQRFAAELHDIQGHTLQVIALKSELAERLAGTDPALAAEQMREVQALARQALGDTRDIVQGYRGVSLGTEVANAARVLAAAGVASSVAPASGLPALPPSVEKLFGLVVRECTTNVLRHSSASRCEISLTAEPEGVMLRFINDAPLTEAAGPLGGLAGLSDRLAAAGGRLRSAHTAETFSVSATLPLPAAP